MENREFASDLAVAFWFLDEYGQALEILKWAEPSTANDWLHAELLFASRRYVEALELLNHLEVKYVNDPEATFSVSYIRAQCLRGLGQQAAALEILRSIVRIRPNYRSANALILAWTEGGAWE
ncbi:MAG: hypothetical protein HC902_09105 [Calothrix sp. SM1_5_4]|nr:hypothetical protein [Calothrix sp. SM1_5_4]